MSSVTTTLSGITRRVQLHILVGLFSLLATGRAEVIGVNLAEASEDRSASADSDNGIANLFDPLLRLNRYTFHKTILEQSSADAPHWIVIFCPSWYEPCQALQPTYRQLAEMWQEQLNGALLYTQVRFASVDCGTEKDLCNTQNVGTNYPFVAHYHDRQQTATWKGKSFETDPQRLKAFLRKQLGSVSTAVIAQPDKDITSEGMHSIPVDCLLIFAAIAGNAWFIGRGSSGGEVASGVSRVGGAKPSMEDSPLVSRPARQPTSCVGRFLPKQWGNERPSLEL